MRWLSLVGAALDRLVGLIVALQLIGLLVLVALQVVDRHFIDVPITAPDAYARILVIWLTFLGFALAAREGLAIRVDLFDHLFAPRVKALLFVFFSLLKLGALAVLIDKGWLLVQLGQDQMILGTDLTTAVPNAGLWLGAVLLFTFLIIQIIEAFVKRQNS